MNCDIGAVADVNNDGHLDVVSTVMDQAIGANFWGVSVLLGQGNGRFGSRLRSPLPHVPLTISISDFNADGAPDLAVGSLAHEIFILLGQGDGTFDSASSLPVEIGRALSVVSADLNRDGAPDVAAANSLSSTIDVLLGAGDGTFTPHTTTPIGAHPYSMLVDDFNRDTFPDLAAANVGPQTGKPASVGVALGRGDGTFNAPIVHLTGSSSGNGPAHFPQIIKGGDFDSDGVPDLLAGSPSGSISGLRPLVLLLGRGDGSLMRGPDVPLSHDARLTSWHANSFAAGDLDGDGALDIVAADADVRLAPGNGDGTFDPAVPLGVASNGQSVAIQDVNEDREADLLVVEGQDDLLVYLNQGDGVLAKPPTWPVGGRARDLAGGDFDNDALPDLALITNVSGLPQRSVSVLYGQGNRTFAPAVLIPIGAQAASLATGDVNGDQRDDLLVRIPGSSPDNDPGEIRIYLSPESGIFSTYLTVTSVVNPQEFVVLDANLDGDLDLVVLNATSSDLSVHLGRGDGTFLDGARTGVGAGSQSLVVADLNGDVFPDLSMVDRDARLILILAGDGQGHFTPLDPIRLEREPLSVAPGRLDGDAQTDLLVSTRDDGQFSTSLLQVAAYIGAGDGRFRLGSPFAVDGLQAQLPRIADYDADGISDVAYLSGSGHAVFQGRGDGTFLPEVRFHTAGTFGPSVAMDLDNDRRVDLATSSSTKDLLTVLYNQGPFPIHPVAIDIVPGSQSNPVNPASNGITAVAILGDPDLAVTDVVPGTIRLAGASVWTDPRLGQPKCRTTDVNDDGRPDLVCHVLSAEMSLTPDSREAELTAEMPDGIRIRGRDAVRVVGPGVGGTTARGKPATD